MTPEQTTLIKASWAEVLPIKERAATLFYGRLFEIDPGVKALFNGDMAEQGRKLMVMINTAVNGLDRLDTIVPAVQELGRRHVVYGVEDHHYDSVGDALLWTLEQGLGSGFTPAVREAWSAVYMLLATTMKQAAAKAA